MLHTSVYLQVIHLYAVKLLLDVSDAGEMVEWVKDSAYGFPFGLSRGDQDSDGDLDSRDVSAIQTWGAGGYDLRHAEHEQCPNVV